MAKILTNFLIRKDYARDKILKVEFFDNLKTFFALEEDGDIRKKLAFNTDNSNISYNSSFTTSEFNSFTLPNSETATCILAINDTLNNDKILAFSLSGNVYYTVDANNWSQIPNVNIPNVTQAIYVNNKIIVLSDTTAYQNNIPVYKIWYSNDYGSNFYTLLYDTEQWDVTFGKSDFSNTINYYDADKLIACYSAGGNSYAFLTTSTPFSTSSQTFSTQDYPIKLSFSNNVLHFTQTTVSQWPSNRYQARFTDIFCIDQVVWGIMSYADSEDHTIIHNAIYYLNSENTWIPSEAENVEIKYSTEISSIPSNSTLITYGFPSYNFSRCAFSSYNGENFIFTKNEIFKVEDETQTLTGTPRISFTLLKNSFTRTDNNNNITFNLSKYQTFCQYGTYFVFALNDVSNELKLFVSFLEFTITLYKKSLGSRDFVYPVGSASYYPITINNNVILKDGEASSGEYSLNHDYYTFNYLKHSNTTSAPQLVFTNNKYTIYGSILQDDEYYAYYTPITYNITYIDRSNTATPSSQYQTYTIEDNNVILPTTNFLEDRSGYSGYYWCSDSTLQTRVDSFSHETGNKTFYAKWVPITYTITYYNVSDITSGFLTPLSYNVETATFNLPIIGKNGYTFNGWYDNSDFTGSAITDVSIGSTGNKTFYAKWTIINYSITYYNTSGITSGTLSPISYNIQTVTFNLPTIDKTGYIFAGWYDNSTLNGSAITQVAIGSYGNKTFYAKWIPITYTITYYNASDITGGVLSPSSYTIETATFDLPIVSKYGYTFQGWYNNPDLTGTEITQIALGSMGSIPFYAKWKINTYNIAYAIGAGTGDISNPTTYNITQLPITIKPPTREHYTFSHWTCVNDDVSITLLENDNSRVSIEAEDVDSVTDFTLVAHWIPITYNIVLNADGGTITSGGTETSSISYTIEDSLKLPGDTGGATIAKTNYVLVRWIDATSAETITASSLIASPRNCAIKAVWTPHIYIITYDFDGGTALDNSYPASYTIEDSYIRMPRAVKDGHPTSHYILAGDEITSYTAISVVDFVDSTTGAAQNLSFTAVYDTGSYVVTYYYFVKVNDAITNLYESTHNISNPNIWFYDESASYTLREPYAAGFTFSKWRKGSTSGDVVSSIVANEQNSYVYYAEFTLKIYDITYHLNGGVNNVNNVSAYSALANVTFDESNKPTKTNYEFVGWYDNEAFEGSLITTLNAAIYGNVNLYAKWELATYTITYDANGGVIVGSNTMSYNCENIQNLSSAVKNGYILDGWYIEGNNTIYTTTQGLSGNVTLKAKWSEVKHSNTGHVNAISYDTALKIIRNELIETMEDNYAYYQDLRVIIANEQEFIKYKQQQPNAVYIVLKYGSASVNFGQSVLPVTITVIAEQNKIDKIQNLLADFVAKFNLEISENNTIQQIYETPTVTSNFNKMFEGFRSVMYVSGYLVVSKTANFFTFSYAKDGSLKVMNTYLDTAETILEDAVNVIVNEDYLAYLAQKPCTYVLEVNSDGINSVNYIVRRYNESNVLEETFTTTSLNELTQYYGIEVEVTDADGVYAFDYTIKLGYRDIEVITYIFSGNTQLDTQAFYNVKNFTESKAKTGTIVLSFTTYLLSSIDIVNDVLDVYLRKIDIDREFKIYVNPTFGNPILETFKLQDCNIQGDIGKIPMITMVFTN